MNKVILGNKLGIEDIVNVARNGYKVEFSDEYIKRVVDCRKLVDKFSDEERVIYGITTGLGDNCSKFISKEDRETIQRNTILSHATSLGEPLNEECVRAIMMVILNHAGSGYTGIRIETLEHIKGMLNNNVIPFAPRHGSVGYLGVEAHIGLVMIGEGKAWYNGELMKGSSALELAGMKPVILSSKEGLTLISGTSSVTALTTLAIYDAYNLAKMSDISGAMSLEVLKGKLTPMDERLMNVRPHVHQGNTASNIRNILKDSEIVAKYKEYRVQDALSVRAMPQLHGASKKIIADSIETLTIELNSTVDNPIIFSDGEGDGLAIMGCNCDGAYAGIAADTVAIAVTNLMKMSERRIDRMINRHLSELPAFLSSNPGLNNGIMIPQYSAAGIIGEMRILSHPATTDNVVTSASQEDYVSMGYNAALKAYQCVDLAKYILAIELLCSTQAQDFYKDLSSAKATKAVYNLIREEICFIDKDCNMHPYMEHIANLVKENKVLKVVEDAIGELEF